MKKKFIFGIGLLTAILFFVILSCQKKELSSNEEMLNLKSPSGQTIANSISSLKTEASEIITQKFGSKQDFELTGIEYFSAKKGFAAMISYKLKNGTVGNYACFSDVNYTIDSQSLSSLVKNKHQVTNSQLKIAMDKYTISCSGSCGCRVTGTLSDSGITWGCSCVGCTATVTVN